MRHLDFHKGSYFLTADKSNSALAMAEGLHPIYIGPPVLRNDDPIHAFQLIDKSNGSDKKLRMNVPLGNIIYEMAVTFGRINISVGGKNITLSPDTKGKSLEPWLHKQLRIRKRDLENLKEDYKGKCHLKLAVDVWKELIAKFEDSEWISDMRDVFFE